MKNNLIDLFEENLPKELIPQFPENMSQESKDAFEQTRVFLLKDAAENYFNIFFRKILEKQIEMRENSNSDLPFHTDWIYPKNLMDKYMSCLDDNDELVIRYKNADFGDWAGTAKDYGLF
jgi:hypothetical protein